MKKNKSRKKAKSRNKSTRSTPKTHAHRASVRPSSISLTIVHTFLWSLAWLFLSGSLNSGLAPAKAADDARLIFQFNWQFIVFTVDWGLLMVGMVLVTISVMLMVLDHYRKTDA